MAWFMGHRLVIQDSWEAEQRQEDCKFNVSLGYRVSSRPKLVKLTETLS